MISKNNHCYVSFDLFNYSFIYFEGVPFKPPIPTKHSLFDQNAYKITEWIDSNVCERKNIWFFFWYYLAGDGNNYYYTFSYFQLIYVSKY